MSSVSVKKEPRCAFSFLSKVPVKKAPPFSPKEHLWSELPAYRAIFTYLSNPLKIIVNKEIYLDKRRYKDLNPV
jgi:hypothetical protein